jgi:uncharacterized membrane protein YqhA
MLAKSHFLILLPVFGALVGALVIFVYDIITTFMLAYQVFTVGAYNEEGVKDVAVGFIKLLDLFLLGTVLYIVAIGLYELFIDPHIPMPAWLHIASINTLKEKLLNVVAVLLVVSFLGVAIEWKGGTDILFYGGAIGIVVASVAFLLFVQNKSDGKSSNDKGGGH